MRITLRHCIVMMVVVALTMGQAAARGTAEELDEPMVFAGWSGSEEASAPVFEEKISRWNEANPDNLVEWLGWPWSDTLDQLLIRSQGGERLDVAQLQLGWAEVIAPTGLLVDLNEVIGEAWLEENIPAASLEAGVIDGKQLAVPYTSASIGMVHNPSLLAEAGIDQLPETIEEFESALEALAAYDPDMVPYAATTTDAGSVAQDLNAWFWTFGGQIIDEQGNVVLESSENEAAVEWLVSLKERDLIVMDMSRFDARVLFAEQQIGFYDDAILAKGIAIDNGIPEDDWDDYIVPMMRPTLSADDDPQSVLWGHQLAIFENARNKEAAGEFIKHLIGEEIGVYYFEQSGLPPVHNDAINHPSVTEDMWADTWLAITDYGRNHELLQFESVSELQSILTEEFQAALIGDKTASQMLSDTAARIESVIY